MRIVQISKSDVLGGGASAVAVELTRQLEKMGHSAVHLSSTGLSEENLYGSPSVTIKKLQKVAGKKGYRDYFPVELLSKKIRSLPDNYDVAHLHDMSWTLSHRVILWLAERMPVVWTLHDCSPFTAGCLYPGACDKFLNSCHDCPQMYSWPLDSKKAKVELLHEARKKLHEGKILFTGPSQWIIDQYKSVSWKTAPAFHVTNGVDLTTYRAFDRSNMRKKYNIPNDGRPILSFAANSLGDSRKGPSDVASFMRTIKKTNAYLLLIGKYHDDAHRIFSEFNFSHFGFIKNPETKAEIISASDGMFVFSQEENCPLVILESLACGTPVICFSNGGIPSLVENGVTGLIFGNEGEFRNNDALLIENLKALNGMRDNCRRVAEERHDYKKIATSYLDLYQMAINQRQI